MLPSRLLQQLAAHVSDTPSAAAGLDACLALLSAQAALPQVAEWFARTRLSSEALDASKGAWMSRVSTAGATALQALASRILFLSSDTRYSALVGNSGAGWARSSFVVLDAPPSDALKQRVLEARFTGAPRPTPPGTLLHVRYDREAPDVRMGHEMVALELNGEAAITYWPALGAEFNHFDPDGVLRRACETLGLDAVAPMQLGAFLSVVASAHADQTESWGDAAGLFAFEEGNIPYLMRTFSADK